MNSEKLKEILNQIPFSLIALGYILYVGYQYYDFTTGAQSPLLAKEEEVTKLKKERETLERRMKEVEEFKKTVDQKRVQLIALAKQLEGMKDTISENLDVPKLITDVTRLAKESRIVIDGFKRDGDQAVKEYYAEQMFSLEYSGIFAQVLNLIKKISEAHNIMKITNIQMKPKVSGRSRYVLLNGYMKIKVYRYVGSAADSLGKDSKDGNASGNRNPAGQGKNPG